MQFVVRFYYTATGSKPIVDFLEDLRVRDPILHKLLIAGIKKIELSDYHGMPLTEKADKNHNIFELRVGSANIARAFFFFQRGQEIIITNGYVKKSQKLDKMNWQRLRHTNRIGRNEIHESPRYTF